MTSNPVVSVPKVIWLLWLQGWEHTPEIVQASKTSWLNRNPGWKVWLLDRTSLDMFIPPDRLYRILSTNASHAALSDLIRLELLHRYGGVWADATTICAKPLDGWLNQCARQGFFAFDRPGPNRMISTWFLAAHRGSYIVELWREAAARYWHERIVCDDYLWIHNLFGQIYETDVHFQSIWNSVPKISAVHSFHFSPNAQALYESPTSAHKEGLLSPPVPVFKLTHKLSRPIGDHSLIAAICAFAKLEKDRKKSLSYRRVLVIWYGSFAHGTIGDLLSMESVVTYLHALGHQVSHATDLNVEIPGCQRIDWRTVDAASFDCVVFVCGPILKSHVHLRKLFSRFSFSPIAGVGVSLLSHNPFQVVFARQGGNKDYGDVAIVAPKPLRTEGLNHKRSPKIGVVLSGKQGEYGAERCLWKETETLVLRTALAAICDNQGNITHIENHLVRSGISPYEIEQQYSECDLIITSRFHGGIEALRSGVPFIAIDQIKGGAKVVPLLSQLGWPYVYKVDNVNLDEIADVASELLKDPKKKHLLDARNKAVSLANDTLESLSEWILSNSVVPQRYLQKVAKNECNNSKIAAKHPPMPIIVASTRSGTTLLRLMLDAHPDLSIPPETHFIGALFNLQGDSSSLRENFHRIVTTHERWADFHLSPIDLYENLEKIEPFTISDGIRCFYYMYAARFNKKRWGDKIPPYILCMNDIQTLLPEARFIHLIRDGRDVALSMRNLWWGPGADMKRQASHWLGWIREARQQAQFLNYYIEVYYEDLIRNTEKVLREICAFIEIPYDKAMLGYYRTAASRLDEFGDRHSPDGYTYTKQQRLSVFKYTSEPPNVSRVERWRREMSEGDRAKFEAVAGSMLRDLGYDTGKIQQRNNFVGRLAEIQADLD